jgi:hypothetical protein
MNAHLWHGGTANRTSRPRLAMHAFYCRRDKPQQQYQKKLLRPEVQASLSAGAKGHPGAGRCRERRLERDSLRPERLLEVISPLALRQEKQYSPVEVEGERMTDLKRIDLPLGTVQAAALEPVQRRIEGSLLHLDAGTTAWRTLSRTIDVILGSA